ncbi:hypothetical protein PVK06_014891 [Gossypium arboreum]|uniref:Uncharacterized protein n=1 Tax=Gossypium arboreum TaxID=29729 RepID=A0ABR0PWA7_GOSAR|nr:hypothetical protein PVK06_014891 [Gossypium arboreum]
MLPPGFGKNLQEVLLSRKRGNKKKMTLFASPAEIDGATAYEGLPRVDCVSLALSGAVFSWSKPLPVISGRNRGRSFGHNMKGEESQESDFKDAVSLCLLLINAAILDIEKGVFPKSCFSKCRNSYFSFSKQGSDSLFYGHKEHMAVITMT